MIAVGVLVAFHDPFPVFPAAQPPPPPAAPSAAAAVTAQLNEKLGSADIVMKDERGKIQ